jgi:hypothetical protein
MTAGSGSLTAGHDPVYGVTYGQRPGCLRASDGKIDASRRSLKYLLSVSQLNRRPQRKLNIDEAAAYHLLQIRQNILFWAHHRARQGKQQCDHIGGYAGDAASCAPNGV